MTTRTATLHAVVLDCPDPRALAEFYPGLLGWRMTEDSDGWTTLTNPAGGTLVEFQPDPHFRPPTWPDQERPQMLHLDLGVADLDTAHREAVALGATPLTEVKGTRESPWRVYADPAGHPFCLVTGQP